MLAIAWSELRRSGIFVAPMKQRITNTAVGTGGILLCYVVAYGFWCLLPLQGPVLLSLGILGVLVVLFGLYLRRAAGWAVWDFLFSLAGAEVIAGCVVLFLYLPFAEPWRWFARVTLFVAPSWALGYGLGTVCLLGAERGKPVLVRSWVMAAVYTLCGLGALVLIPELRRAYGQSSVPLPSLTLFLIRMSPELWFFLALGLAAFSVSKDLLFRHGWLNVILAVSLVPLALALVLPLV